MIATGLILIYSGVTDRNPLEVVKAAIRGEDLPESGSFSEDIDVSEELEQSPEEGDEEWHHAPDDTPGEPYSPDTEYT